MRSSKLLGLLLLSNLLSSATLFAQYEPKDPRQSPELTVCSQNLQNYGSYTDSKARVVELTPAIFESKKAGLVRRFEVAGCDVIAVQEVLGKTEEAALEALNVLTKTLTESSGRLFEARVSPDSDGSIRNGFIIARDRSDILNLISYSRVELPKLLETQKARVFDRSPLELQLEVKGKEGSESRIVALINFHLKSRAGASLDPSGLEFETVRMEMAESISRIVDIRHSAAMENSDRLLVILGDRNTHYEMASARILEGTLSLVDFKTDGPCRLSKRGVPICQTETRRPQKLFSVLTSDPETAGVAGSYVYKDEPSWIDDILLPQVGLKFALADSFVEGNYDSGTVSKPKVASDHSLVFTRLNW